MLHARIRSSGRLCRCRRRGYALLIAIAVLAILTILVTGLSASRQSVLSTVVHGEMQSEARRLARLGRDAALSHLAAGSRPPALDGGGGEVVVGESDGARGYFVLALSGADADTSFGPADMPVYGAGELAHRPGDSLAAVEAVVRRGRRGLRMRHLYLLNAVPGAERSVLLMETQDGAF